MVPGKKARKRCEDPESSEWQRDDTGNMFFATRGQPHIVARLEAAQRELALIGTGAQPFGHEDLRALERMKKA